MRRKSEDESAVVVAVVVALVVVGGGDGRGSEMVMEGCGGVEWEDGIVSAVDGEVSAMVCCVQETIQ